MILTLKTVAALSVCLYLSHAPTLAQSDASPTPFPDVDLTPDPERESVAGDSCYPYVQMMLFPD
jgi:hypothetical protein